MEKLLPSWCSRGIFFIFCLGLHGVSVFAQTPFISKWKTTTASESITIKKNPGPLIYDYTVVWGDGETTTGHTGDATHVYAAAGTYTVEISGAFPAIYRTGPKIVTIEQWGTNPWQSMDWAFAQAVNLNITATDVPNLTNVRDMYGMFIDATNFDGNLEYWDVSAVTNMGSMFSYATVFNRNISGWDVSAALDMTSMFEGAAAFNQDISTWDVSHVRDFTNMFYGAKLFNQNINGWDVSNAIQMGGMFMQALAYNQPLNNWDVSSVEGMNGMFLGSPAFNQDISGWVTSKVKTMSYMFFMAGAFNQNLNSWDVGAVEDMESMFSFTTNFNSNLDAWNVSKVKNFKSVFSPSSAFNQSLASWNLSSATSIQNMLSNSQISRANYDATLNGWASQSEFPQNLELGASGLKFCWGKVARQQLITDLGWTFSGDSEDCSMQILIADQAGETFTLGVFLSDAIQQVKQKIEDQEGISVLSQKLSFGGTPLMEGLTLQDYGVVNGSTLRLERVAVPDASGIVYVDSTAAIYGDGSSWVKALRLLSDATKAAVSNVTISEIHVAKGIYYPTGAQSGTNRDSAFAILRGGLKLIGGYPNGGGVRDVALNRTVLSGNINQANTNGDNSYHVLVIAGIAVAADSIVLDGFTITGGKAYGGPSAHRVWNGVGVLGNSGGGIAAYSVLNQHKTVVRACTFQANEADFLGGGLLNNGSSITLLNGIFSANFSNHGGGGLATEGSTANSKVVKTRFLRNTSTLGGGVYNKLGSSSFVNVVFAGNEGAFGGGGYCESQASDSFYNVVFSGNGANGMGGAVRNEGGKFSKFYNCTIASNKSVLLNRGGGVYSSNSDIVIKNSIVYGNGQDGVFREGGTLDVGYSLLEGFSGGTGNLHGNLNPRFVNPIFGGNAPFVNGDYRLQACSPAINSGENAEPAASLFQDVDGLSRVVHGSVDMGAYEFQSALLTGSASLALHEDESIQTLNGVTDFFGNDEACRLIARISPYGVNPVTGSVTVRVNVDPQVGVHNGAPYVQRHYLINAQSGEGASVTLYFTQAEFDQFNEALPLGKLPTGPEDLANMGNLQIFQYHGTSGSAPSDFPGSAPSVISPLPENIIWNASRERWEVNFTVVGFSGFFVGSKAKPLPVKLVSFSGSPDENGLVNLKWKVVAQENIYAYEVQYSSNGKAFQKVGTVGANSYEQSEYTFAHMSAGRTDLAYYRLRILEVDGKEAFSRVVVIKLRERTEVFAFPLPAENRLQIGGKRLVGTTATLVNASGLSLKSWTFASDSQFIDVEALPSGIYFVRFDDGTGVKFVKK